MKDYSKYASIPLKQLPNRVWRTYTGGLLIDQFQQNESPADGSTPEEWIMSTVIARGDNRPENEGLSQIITPDGFLYLSDLIQSDPESFLGKTIVEKSEGMGILIKLLDARERLTIQVHPDKKFAWNELNSQYGKTEGWYILNTREIDGEEGYVLMGFKEGITREKWVELFNNQDIEGMRNALHKIPVKSGDVFIIHGGVPHAIGGGCFLLEIQEPTDYTMRVEKVTPRGSKVGDFLIHQGIGEEKMLDCFHYESASLSQTLSKWKANPLLLTDTESVKIYSLLDLRYTDCFSVQKIILLSTYMIETKNTFYVIVVSQGKGFLNTKAGGEIAIKQGDSFFMPANIGNVLLKTTTKLQILFCMPPVH
jgi:mannose-6-phosphate isomerase